MKHLIRVIAVLTVIFATDTMASTNSPLTPEELHFKELLARLSAASGDRIRGLTNIECDYRLLGTYDLEKGSADTNPPPVKLAASGKLTIQLPKEPIEWELDNFPGTFNTFRFEPDAWPELTNELSEAEAKEFRAFPIAGSKVICSGEAGSWLVSQDDKTAIRFKLPVGENPLFGVIVPAVCCHYEAGMIQFLRGGSVRDTIARRGGSTSLAGRKCAKYVFKIPPGRGAPGGSYIVLLDEATGLPLRETLSGLTDAGVSITTYSDLRRFGEGSFSPAKSGSTSRDTADEAPFQMEIQYAPFGSQWFLTKEMSLRSGDGFCKLTFSNWRQVSVPDSAFKLPPGAKVASSEDSADKGNGENK